MNLQLLVVFLVGLIVFGPARLPMVANHLGLLLRKLRQLNTQAMTFWQQQLNEYQLRENQRKAEEVDKRY